MASLKECVAEVGDRAQKSMTFVLLQEVVCSIPQGLFLQQRRDVVFSQAVGQTPQSSYKYKGAGTYVSKCALPTYDTFQSVFKDPKLKTYK